MLNNFRLTIEYDGTAYNGWQRQKTGRTIQGEIENAVCVMTRQKVTLTGAGRTDAGVHALGQVANFVCDTTLEPGVFIKGLNSLLPGDIIIRDCVSEKQEFHSRYDAKSKIYNYRILNREIPSAIERYYTWFIRKKIDVDAMQKAAFHLIGTHDFKAFEGTGSPRKSTIRSVSRAGVLLKKDDLIIFEIEADGFLRFMVRNIVGTLVCVGLGKIKDSDFKGILESRDRGNAGITAPPQGLFLVEVKY
ncbi:MAG: tRNA pseudouridine(38-40) synthase TruA [Proteobacteria bacterium]|nr:tRNA pseudouridine(38-40) synthase TruA [Pseudomonadota bacterium]MBU1570173.1 tRNA pseudouridine(38-40) synthase TruA [Pseudomonadota bacterium]